MTADQKYRARRIDNKEWVYGYPSPEGTGQFSIGWIEIGGGNITNEGDYEYWHCHKIDPLTLGQYTTLKYRGVELYGGQKFKKKKYVAVRQSAKLVHQGIEMIATYPTHTITMVNGCWCVCEDGHDYKETMPTYLWKWIEEGDSELIIE